MSAEAPRPWWATPDDPGHLDEQDPVAAHRAARRGDGQDDAGPAGDADDGDGDAGHDPDVCGVCPWCTGLRMLSTSHPEVVGHLTDAARHLTQAVRTLVADLQGPAETNGATGGRDDGQREAPFERIDLD
ncbi:MAG: hypothetical protein WD378_02185 [Egicoccus sp.]